MLPSLPGFGFSAEPAELGWDPGRIARAWAELMSRLGYTRYVAQGGDLGAYVCDEMGRQAPAGLLGIHLNLLKTALVGPPPAEPSEEERAALTAIAIMQTSGYGYFLEQATRPQTIGYTLLDSPVALAAWILYHDTDSYYKISRAFLDGQPSGHLTRDRILDNIMLYWLTGTGASAAREYWENGQAAARGTGQALRRSRSRSASLSFPARSSGPRAAGSRRPTPPSPTSMRSTEAATSPPGKSPDCSRPRSRRRSSHCANDSPPPATGIRGRPSPPTRSFASTTAVRGHGCGSRKESLMSTEGKALAEEGTPAYVTRFDGVRVPATDYHPVWLDNLADDVTIEGSAMNGVVQGAEAIRAIVTCIRALYDSQEFNFAGPYGENGFLEDYTAQVRGGEQIGNVVLVTRNAAGQAQHIVANYRPRTTLLHLSRLIGEQLAGTPYGEHFATSALE